MSEIVVRDGVVRIVDPLAYTELVGQIRTSETTCVQVAAGTRDGARWVCLQGMINVAAQGQPGRWMYHERAVYLPAARSRRSCPRWSELPAVQRRLVRKRA